MRQLCGRRRRGVTVPECLRVVWPALAARVLRQNVSTSGWLAEGEGLGQVLEGRWGLQAALAQAHAPVIVSWGA